MELEHEAPTTLRVRPTVTLRQIPGKAIRVPARGATILLVAVIAWGVGVALIHLPWYELAGMLLIPALALTLLVELRPQGKAPLGWLYVISRHLRRATTLRVQRLAAPTTPPRGRRH